MTSEEVREKRRAERKQFKLDRAAAIAKAAAEAEAAFVEGREAAPAFIPSGATWKPQQSSEVWSLPPQPPEDEDEKHGHAPRASPLQLWRMTTVFTTWRIFLRAHYVGLLLRVPCGPTTVGRLRFGKTTWNRLARRYTTGFIDASSRRRSDHVEN